MAISITSEPDALSLAKNQVLYRAETDQYITTVGVPYFTTLQCAPTVPTDGETLIIEVLGQTFTYTFLDAPTPGNCYHIDRAGGVLATMNANMYAALNNNFYLVRYYDATLGIGIRAKAAGTEYILAISGTAKVSGHVTNVPTVGNAEVLRDDFNMAWDLWMGADSSSEPDEFIVGQMLRPDADQKVYPDMRELLEKQLSPDVPTYATDVIAYNANSLRKFMIRFGEFYDGLVQCYEKATVKKVMLAGIALERWPFVNFAGVYGAGISGQKFLTNLPRTMEIDRESQIFLSILVDAEYDVLVDIYWNDDTDTSGVTLYSVAGNAKTMAIIPAGFDTHNLISLLPVGATHPVSYQIYVQQGGGESEHYEFILDKNYKINPRRIIFHNSLNGWDTLWCTGDQSRMVANNGDDFDTEVPRTFKADAVELLIVPSNTATEDLDQKRGFELNTGHKRKAYIQSVARELPLSRMVLLDTGTEWRELKIDRKSIKEIDNDADDLWSLSFSYTYGQIDKAY